MFDDDSFGKMANSDGYDTIFMEWKYWMRLFANDLEEKELIHNDDFMAYIQTEGRQNEFANYLMATLP